MPDLDLYRVVKMDFYGHNDIPLGGFLERFCFRESYRCPNEACTTSLVNHLRRCVHTLTSSRA